MFKRTFHIAVVSLFVSTLSVQAAALRENEGVTNRLVLAGIVKEIYKKCPTISVRKLRGFMYLRSIYNYAVDQGFSHEEIEAYVENEEEEARLLVHVNTWLSNRGAVEGNPESYCAIGKAEIDAESPIGKFLRTD
ncbi:DUF5333 domain-containing protein [Pseudohalocynthiibacter aestuariivivens]|jgi:Family of unknown function (DUF5333)|uniref:DUF5333 domain-containing protein n=1 Tax=Pseudohalocynthiibacter aestuariivivens TaxID=1591409 RepID=A0ABV5JLW5_9RHOB|nr:MULTISPECIES: DUF5333 domain-containing protein [Pseudohalocynthiibacter]MBS9716701.1 DUF5333 domain-containing protein [Pseudohalocynthiibacter aestuariivivens]MCK0101783.1 DUF5333 domain-containing protein [Pseudohalocynthiibacter sp. F2068]